MNQIVTTGAKPAEFVIKKTLMCPACKGDSKCSIDHLLEKAKVGEPQDFGPWDCDACDMAIKGIVRENQGQKFVDVEAVPARAKHPKLMTLLVLPPQKEPMYFLKNDTGYVVKGDAIEKALDREYYFNMHSCPTNWMENFETIQIGNDADPHGVIVHVRSVFKEEYDKVEEAVRKKHGMANSGGTYDELEQEILETVFPEVANRFVPAIDDFGFHEDDVIEQKMGEVPNEPYRYKSHYNHTEDDIVWRT